MHFIRAILHIHVLYGFFSIAAICILCACNPISPPVNNSGLQAITPVPTLDEMNPAVLCDVVEANWVRNWPTVIRALEALNNISAECDEQSNSGERLYSAYIQYGILLENRQRIEDAVQAYQTALTIAPQGSEAIDALTRLHIISPTLVPPTCDIDTIEAAREAVPRYRPGAGAFVQIEGTQFRLNGRPFSLYGIDYYPRDTPWRRFLSETEVDKLEPEFRLVQESGLNTLRISMRHDLLFQCAGNGAVPIPQSIIRLDEIIQAAVAQGFHLILALNDMPDLTEYPLYSNPQHSADQMIYLADRYRDEPAILAWDLRQAGDLDYGSGQFERRVVLEWLVDSAILMRETDPNHLITASWAQDITATSPAVDFVSFQVSDNVDDLRQQIATLKAATSKPIVANSIGFSTFGSSEEGQRDSFQAALDAVSNNGLAGWLVWTAFDFPLTVTCYEMDCINQDSADHHFGLWTTEYSEKLAVGVVEMATGVK
jgi:hypothetical protein